MSQRDDDFARLAAEYRKAHADVTEAERQANQAFNAAAAARSDRDRLKKKLADFVGRNIRIRNAIVGGELVRVEYHGSLMEDHAPTRVEVSVEPVTAGPREG